MVSSPSITNWTMDTVAVLTDQNVKPLLVVYLRTKESINITGIKDGEYSLYFTIGDQWDGKAGTIFKRLRLLSLQYTIAICDR